MKIPYCGLSLEMQHLSKQHVILKTMGQALVTMQLM